MGRKSSFAAVYTFIDMSNYKMYIGESDNVLRRLVDHRASNSYLSKIGADDLLFVILESELTDPRIADADYRAKREAFYIDLYNATDANSGYNKLKEFWHHTNMPHRRALCKLTNTRANIKKSHALIAYNIENEECMLFLGRESFAKMIKGDRSHVAKSLHIGRRIGKFVLYPVSGKDRYETAVSIITHKLTCNSTNGKAELSLARYYKGLIAVNEYCEHWDLPVIDIPELDIGRLIKDD